MIGRRVVLGMIGGSAVALSYLARAQSRSYRIGFLSVGFANAAPGPRVTGFIEGLARRGFAVGQNLIFDNRFAEAHGERNGALAAELASNHVDLIATIGFPAALAAKRATATIPIVVQGAGDPVATGLVEGLAHPGGNLTGIAEIEAELSTKRLELLKELVPGLAKVAMIWNADDLAMTLRVNAADKAARTLAVEIQTLGVHEPEDFTGAFDAMRRSPPDAILMVSDVLTNLNRRRVMEFAATNRLPTIFEVSPIVRDGGLISYGPKLALIGDMMAEYVARILRGARPEDLPFEEPREFELAINLKTARTLGLTIPPLLLARADEVIE